LLSNSPGQRAVHAERSSCFDFYHSIRFAPPLVIEEEDLLKAIKLIEESLVEIDTVSSRYAAIKLSCNMLMRCRLAPQLDKIPGDDSEEKNTVIGLED
jgi:hypothetical protein